MCAVGGVKIKVGLSRKEGTDNYGSIGASVEVEVELHGATIGDIQGARDQWLSWCAEAVDRAIADQRSAGGAAPAPHHGPAPAALPAPNGHPAPAPAPSRPQGWGTAYPSAGAAPPPSGAQRRGGGGNQDGPPRSGGGLYARLKGMDEQTPALKIVQHVKDWAKAGGNDGRFSDWTSEWVSAGWGEAQRYLEALRESDRLQAGQ
jgi:hypothetical protein